MQRTLRDEDKALQRELRAFAESFPDHIKTGYIADGEVVPELLREGQPILFYPAAALAITVLVFMMLGDVLRDLGLDAAGAVLGHSRLETTQLYAERSQALATRVAAECG